LRYLLFVIPALFILLLSYFRVFDLYEFQTYDWRCQLRGDRPTSEDILFIDIWDDTLKELGAWPFDRGYHADLIKILGAYGVKAVALDILFVEPRDGDDAVSEAAKEANNVYFVYAFLDPKKKNGRFVSDEMLAPLVPLYEQSAKATGHVNATADVDGKRRKIFPAVFHENRPYYQLSFRIAMDVLGVNEEDIVFQPGRHIQFSKDFKVPLDDDGSFIVNYAGRWEKSFRHYSYYDVLAAYLETTSGVKPRIDLTKFKDKICYVGLTSLGSHDASPVPIQSIYPMVGLHANVLNGILKKDFIRRLDRFLNLLLLSALSCLIVLIALREKPFKALLISLGALSIFSLSVILVFVRWGLWADLFYPFVVLVGVYAAATLGRSLYEIKKRELIENELKIASQIQKSFLPETLPQEPGISIAVYMKPAKAVGGDLYNFIVLDPGKMGVMVGDVSGKGTPAALFMAKVVSEFKFSARQKSGPSETLYSLNQSIASESTGGLFVTLTYAIFDMRLRKLIFSNAGHLPVVFVGSKGATDLLTGGEGMPIGVMEGVSFSNTEKEIREGDCFAFYSDGVSEARNKKKEEYGIETLEKLIKENQKRSAQEILDKAIEALNAFMGKAEQHDDITLIVTKIGSFDEK